jgi:hypothetical protein
VREVGGAYRPDTLGAYVCGTAKEDQSNWQEPPSTQALVSVGVSVPTLGDMPGGYSDPKSLILMAPPGRNRNHAENACNLRDF